MRIAIAIVLGGALVAIFMSALVSICSASGTHPGTLCASMIQSPPWPIVSALGTIPSLTLVWYWRTTHKEADLQIANQQQMSTRFADAVRLLSEPDKLEARLGAIYSLERIANDFSGDLPTVVETLAAFVRERAAKGAESMLVKPATDVRAAVAVVARLVEANQERAPKLPTTSQTDRVRVEFEGAWLAGLLAPRAPFSGANLTATNLKNSYLWQSNLNRACLWRAQLGSAYLSEATMLGCDLRWANLQTARLRGAILVNADLTEADLTDAALPRANLSRAILRRAKLVNTDLSGAFLRKADLTGADLTGSKLEGADLREVRYDGDTKFPAGFAPTPREAGSQL